MHNSQTAMKPEQKQMPHPKSPGGNSGIDVEAELGIQPIRRPTGVDQDVSNLGQTKRVSSVLTSPIFKEELETVVTDLLRSGDGGGHVIAREIANMLSPMGRAQHSFSVGSVTPINDLTGTDISRYTKGEKLLRCKLSAVYRLVDLSGWSQQIYNHITVKVDKEQEHFLINPYGLMYHEVSAAKLIKINMQGDVVDQGATTFSVNKPGFLIHSAIHAGRPDINCIIHVHVPDVIAVSMMECGLLPISLDACSIGEVSYHTYHGMVVDQKEKKLLVKHLGPVNKVMLLRNNGMLACGETVEEAFSLLSTTILACQTQLKVMSCIKLEKIHLLDKSVLKKNSESSGNSDATATENPEEEPIKWGMGELMWEAHMRMLDNMGYRTGYMYKNPTSIYRRSRLKGDIEIPATAHGHTIPLDELQEGRSRLQSHPPSRWVNSPNNYTKVRPVSEEGSAVYNGEPSPLNKTTWKNDEGSSHSTPIRIADANQFVPTNTDPREVAEKRRQIRGQGRWDERGPGPQSQKLDTVHPIDMRVPTDEDDVVTGSKGIIQRQYHEHTVVTGPPNPFTNTSEEEIEKYRLEVSQKMKKDSESEEAHDPAQETVVGHIEVVAQVDHTDEIDGSTGSAPVAQVTVIEVQEALNEMTLTNGHSEPDDKRVEEVAAPPEPPRQEQPTSQKEVKATVTFENKEVPKQDPVPLPPKNPPPKEKVKNEPPKKVNGKDESSTPTPKVEQEIKESPHANPEEKTSKGKNKNKDKDNKKTKRRSLSFLKKKEKKGKE